MRTNKKVCSVIEIVIVAYMWCSWWDIVSFFKMERVKKFSFSFAKWAGNSGSSRWTFCRTSNSAGYKKSFPYVHLVVKCVFTLCDSYNENTFRILWLKIVRRISLLGNVKIFTYRLLHINAPSRNTQSFPILQSEYGYTNPPNIWIYAQLSY